MFRKSPSCTKSADVNRIESHFNGAKQKLFNDPNSWHNVFYALITSCIDESVFSVLYDETQGRPNTSFQPKVF